jgi:hypothetical protein
MGRPPNELDGAVSIRTGPYNAGDDYDESGWEEAGYDEAVF